MVNRACPALGAACVDNLESSRFSGIMTHVTLVVFRDIS